ncbi:MAG: Copper delivery protein (cytochrome c oxidase assembly) [Holophagaceae bacterium]|nr:Copper delivery protein (cytochrome c oxidase assembly) [Holophagaceae bacterium]
MKRMAWLLPLFLSLVPLQAQKAYTPLEAGVEEKLGQPVLAEVVLNDEDGRPVKLGSLIDKPTILTLNYFRCSGICTPQLIGVLEVANLVQAEPGKDFQIITVSFDERDTPEMAWQKRSNFLKEMTRPFPPTAWRFLTGKAADTKAVCDSVGFRFKREGDSFAHAGVLMILSPKGKITRYMYGVNYLPAELQMAITEAARGEARPSVNKWLKFCYTSDPAGKNYVFSATRLVAVLTILAVALFVAVLVISSRRKSRRNHGDRL